jgi:CheY-like chemotaxis protein
MQSDSGVDYFRIEVHDTGIGIKTHDLDAVFDEFKRLDNQIHDNQKGIGLGLAISRRICKLLNLEISVTSRPNIGSVFALRCERAQANQVPVAADSNEAMPKIITSAISGLNILCIDNDTNVLDAMQIQLNIWQCNTLCARGFDEAMESLAVSGFIPEILLVDYHLDNENGIEVISRLNQHFQATLPAIIISADLSIEIKVEATSMGLKYLRKPVNPAALKILMLRISKNHAAALHNEPEQNFG